jgi:hypothetical protein
MRLPRGTVAPIIFVWLSGLGCGKLRSDQDGAVDARSGDVAIADASDAGAANAGASEAGASDADASEANVDASQADVDASQADVDASQETDDGSMDARVDDNGDAEVGCVPESETFTATVTCPADATAVAGVVTPTCEFSHSLAPNNVFTGPVTLVSHLDRDFAAFDVNPIGDGRIQLMCDYANADGLGIGGIYRFIVASSCTATSAASFTCVK